MADLARTKSSEERAAAAAFVAETAALEQQMVADAAQLLAVREEIAAAHIAAYTARAPSAAVGWLGSDEVPDEVVACIGSFLGAKQLGRLACVSRRFTTPAFRNYESRGSGGGEATARTMSVVQEAARRAALRWARASLPSYRLLVRTVCRADVEKDSRLVCSRAVL